MNKYPNFTFNKEQTGFQIAEDFINPTNWSSDLSFFEQKIKQHLTAVTSPSSVPIDVSSLGSPMNVYQTMSGDIINYSILKGIGDKANVQEVVIDDIDSIPNSIIDYLVNLGSINNKLKNNIGKAVSDDIITYHNTYVNYQDEKKSKFVFENTDFSKYKLYPEIIGEDIGSLKTTSQSKSSLSFCASGLFGWNYASPQKRTIGSAVDIGSIIIDIIFRLSETQKEIDNKDVDKNLEKFILSKIQGQYDITKTKKIGIITKKFEKPDSLWLINRASQTPFYNRENMTPTSKRSFLEYLTYNIKDVGNNQLRFELKTINPTSDESIKKEIINQLKKVLIIDTSTLITEPNTSIQNKSGLATIDINSTIKRLEDIDINGWRKIISHAYTTLFFDLIKRAQENKIDFKTSTPPTTYTFLPFDPFAELNKLRNTIRSYLGNTKQRAMGGTSLMGSYPIKVERDGSLQIYPGDTSVLKDIDSYLKNFYSDITQVSNTLNDVLKKMSDKYSYRDIILWLGVFFKVFDPSNPSSVQLLESNFTNIEKMVKRLYAKQIQLKINYLQKKQTATEDELQTFSFYNNSTICYIKRQISIIYYLMDHIFKSSWVKSSTQTTGLYNSDKYNTYSTRLKNQVKLWFRTEITQKSNELPKEHRQEFIKLITELCKTDVISKRTMFNSHFENKVSSRIVSETNFWLLFAGNLKNKSVKEISDKPQNLQRIYIPIYTPTFTKNKYYLFDIMPLVLKGKYLGDLGMKSYPQWVTSSDFKGMKFTRDNSGIIILTNLSSEISDTEKWRAVSKKWLDNLYSKASDQGDKKMWLIRTAIYMLLSNETSYRSKELKKVVLGDNNTNKTDTGNSKLSVMLYELSGLSNGNKNRISKYVELVSREYIQNELTRSLNDYEMM
jgi:hypothetical protein